MSRARDGSTLSLATGLRYCRLVARQTISPSNSGRAVPAEPDSALDETLGFRCRRNSIGEGDEHQTGVGFRPQPEPYHALLDDERQEGLRDDARASHRRHPGHRPPRGEAGIFTGRDAVCRVLAEGKDNAGTKLSEVMTASPKTMTPGATAIDALRLMQDGHFRHLPVIEGNRIVGIVSHGDFRGLELDRIDAQTGIWERL
jgi:hypothetical protein